MTVLTNTSVAGVLVDDSDVDLDDLRWHLGAYGTCIQRSTYDAASQRSGKEKLHRLIVSRMLGRPLRPEEEVDHKNGNPLDNRRANLRVVTHHQNLSNHGSHGGTSDYVGVSWDNLRWKWRATISPDGHQIHIGMFEDEDEAAWMRDQWALALHGDYARLNFDYVPVGSEAAV